ncbi:hypothetical protein J6590_074530 [Homalodisca vitripennis]|nr:hypothetical protein J6590_074530 [Homalodisca vitripennis]
MTLSVLTEKQLVSSFTIHQPRGVQLYFKRFVLSFPDRRVGINDDLQRPHTFSPTSSPLNQCEGNWYASYCSHIVCQSLECLSTENTSDGIVVGGGQVSGVMMEEKPDIPGIALEEEFYKAHS